jgi:hypothetical protein
MKINFILIIRDSYGSHCQREADQGKLIINPMWETSKAKRLLESTGKQGNQIGIHLPVG